MNEIDNQTEPVLTPQAQPRGRGESFSLIRQGRVSNDITKMTAQRGRQYKYNPGSKTAAVSAVKRERQLFSFNANTGEATLSSPDGVTTLTIKDFAGTKGLGVADLQLFDAITVRATETGRREVRITLEEFMEMRKLTNRKEAKKQAIDAIDLFVGMKMKGREQRGNEVIAYGVVPITGKGFVSRSGIITYAFNVDFYKIFSKCPVMPYPRELLAVNGNKNPNAYFFGRKIAEHKNMNRGRPTEDVIAVQTLLEATQLLPSIGEVMKGNRNVRARIIEPFERDMNALSWISWEYLHRGGKPLTDDERAKMDYDGFASLKVKILWHTYTDNITERIAQREAVEELSLKGNKTRRRKK